MKNFKISTRLSLSIALFVIPLALLLYFYTGEITQQIDFAAQETRGNAYLRPLVRLLSDVNSHEIEAYRLHTGDNAAAADLQATAAKIGQDLKALTAIQAQYGEILQFTPAGLKSRHREQLTLANLEAKWNSVSEAAAAPDKVAALPELYQSLSDDVRGMIGHAGDMSNLILDPDLDSYYTMDATVVGLTQGMGRYGQIVGVVTPLLAGQHFTDKQKAQLATFSAMIGEADVGRVKGDMDTAFNEDANFYGVSPSFKGHVMPNIAAYQTANTVFTGSLDALVENPAAVSAATLLKQAQDAQQSSAALWEASTDELDVLLHRRIASLDKDRVTTLIEAGAAMIVAFGFFCYVASSIRRPLKALQKAMLEISAGNLDHAVPCLELRDEVGEMAKTLETFKDNALEARQQEQEKARGQVAKLEQQKRVEALIAQFQQTITELLEQVARSADDMQQSGQNLLNAAIQATEKTTATATATTEASSNVSAVASAAEELSAAINEISGQINRSATVTQDAVSKTHDADRTVQELAQSANKIGEVIQLINDIAGQINLLALNATIESARAGEAGKGFAVVASEVKGLASQTSKATESITIQINAVQNVTSNVVKALGQIQYAINDVNGIASTIAAAVEQQGAATKEIAMNINRTSDRVQLVSQNVSEVNSVAVITNANAQSVLDSVTTFTSQTRKLQEEVRSFLQNIAAA